MRSLWIVLVLVLGSALLLQVVVASDGRIPYARFRSLAESGELAEVEIRDGVYIGRAVPGLGASAPQSYRTGRIEQTEKDLLAALDRRGIPYTRAADERGLLPYLWLALPLTALLAMVHLVSRRSTAAGNVSGAATAFGKNKARLYEERGAAVTFRDVAGSAEAKAELGEIVDFLKAPERYEKLGGRMPRGVLLVGPPGTGKTLLARAIAGEASVPFFSACGSEFVEMFVGVGAARVRDLFSQAREKGTCLVFIDELDAVGKARGIGGSVGGHDEREQTLNQLLTEMDGFDVRAAMVVIAATNRPEILDPALLRAGRFDRRVHVDRPDLAERREILAVHGRKVALDADVDLDAVAAQTAGLVGADLANIVNEAALLAARRRAAAVGQIDLEAAIERGLAGLERRGRRLGARERLVVAYHEVGHALTATLLPTQDPVRKVSIVPRGPGALGYTMQLPREDRYLWSRQEILDRLVVLLGGRAAEAEAVGDLSTGAQDDLLNATELARRMVRELGMGQGVGLSALEPRRPLSFLGEPRGALPPGAGRECSDATAREIDAEVARILSDAEARARAMICGHRATLERIAARLYEVETLSGDELRAMMARGDA
ncbi:MULTISPECIES: ATP-dependent zinc metalloprotease FtsH [Sorangium]|uniref:ATP-dependent zinc metalloprotease FtsH n=1 Tax=Sorangium cellulosum TaxID=56 RepID=A0A4P2QJ80_SORCE|nr:MULTISPECIES: ATP-dependent zinc metalloprotease FtsH [Sorangium]AUX30057.1 cell division protein FtsH [Sorangium cellulosum]WCQ89447.1 ATP-dependent zinc metalloprotease FtsH 4 [Sorangium sp. Soce836]